MICVYLERSDLDLEGKLNHKVFMRKEKDFIYRLALCQSLRQLVPKCQATEGGAARGSRTHIPNEAFLLGSVWERRHGREGAGNGKLTWGRAQGPYSLLPLEGTRVLMSPPDNETELSLINLRKETLQRDGVWGNGNSKKGSNLCSRAGPSLRTAWRTDHPIPRSSG